MRFPRVVLNLLVTGVLVGSGVSSLHTAPEPASGSTPTVSTIAAQPVAATHAIKVTAKHKHVAKHRPKKRHRVHHVSASTAAQRYARSRLSLRQYRCVHALWNRESHWRVTANNPRSSAYGIPQALPGSKMRSAGRDWRTNGKTQVRWGLSYIKKRYGTPCGALAHSNRRGWY